MPVEVSSIQRIKGVKSPRMKEIDDLVNLYVNDKRDIELLREIQSAITSRRSKITGSTSPISEALIVSIEKMVSISKADIDSLYDRVYEYTRLGLLSEYVLDEVKALRKTAVELEKTLKNNNGDLQSLLKLFVKSRELLFKVDLLGKKIDRFEKTYSRVIEDLLNNGYINWRDAVDFSEFHSLSLVEPFISPREVNINVGEDLVKAYEVARRFGFDFFRKLIVTGDMVLIVSPDSILGVKKANDLPGDVASGLAVTLSVEGLSRALSERVSLRVRDGRFMLNDEIVGVIEIGDPLVRNVIMEVEKNVGTRYSTIKLSSEALDFLEQIVEGVTDAIINNRSIVNLMITSNGKVAYPCCNEGGFDKYFVYDLKDFGAEVKEALYNFVYPLYDTKIIKVFLGISRAIGSIPEVFMVKTKDGDYIGAFFTTMKGETLFYMKKTRLYEYFLGTLDQDKIEDSAYLRVRGDSGITGFIADLAGTSKILAYTIEGRPLLLSKATRYRILEGEGDNTYWIVYIGDWDELEGDLSVLEKGKAVVDNLILPRILQVYDSEEVEYRRYEYESAKRAIYDILVDLVNTEPEETGRLRVGPHDNREELECDIEGVNCYLLSRLFANTFKKSGEAIIEVFNVKGEKVVLLSDKSRKFKVLIVSDSLTRSLV